MVRPRLSSAIQPHMLWSVKSLAPYPATPRQGRQDDNPLADASGPRQTVRSYVPIRTRAHSARPAGFEARRHEFVDLPLEQRFSRIFTTNLWASDSRSGLGSELTATAVVREQLPRLLEALGAGSLLDLPCGDFGWLSTVPLDLDYIGGDIVGETGRQQRAAIRRARHTAAVRATRPHRRSVASGRRRVLPRLPRPSVVPPHCQAFDNLRRSGSTWLLTTTFLDHQENADIESGDWRILNLTRPPFNLPAPEAVLVEGCLESDGAYADKALGLWRIADLA